MEQDVESLASRLTTGPESFQRYAWAPAIGNAAALVALTSVIAGSEHPNDAFDNLLVPIALFALGLHAGILGGRSASTAEMLHWLASMRLANAATSIRIIKSPEAETKPTFQLQAEVKQMFDRLSGGAEGVLDAFKAGEKALRLAKRSARLFALAFVVLIFGRVLGVVDFERPAPWRRYLVPAASSSPQTAAPPPKAAPTPKPGPTAPPSLPKSPGPAAAEGAPG